MPRKTALPLACTLALALAACGGATARETTAQTGPAAQTRTIAKLETVDARVVLTARRTSGGSAPDAAVTVAIYTRSGAAWKRTGSHRLTGFWFTVTAPHALCRLAVATAKTSHVEVQLLQSPSLGCGPVHRYPLPAR
jgi:hypothetical protein